MRIEVKVVPGAKKDFLKEEEGRWKIYLRAPALEGRANKALIKFLSERLKVAKSQIEIIKGLKSRRKTIKISSKIFNKTKNEPAR